MKASLVRQFGGPEVLRLEEVPTPKPGAGQVLVKIHAAGVNPADTYARTGTYAVLPSLPYTPGTDGAGVVDSIGDGVKKVNLGDRVYVAKSLSGTYAEYALALESQVYRLPDRISFAQQRSAKRSSVPVLLGKGGSFRKIALRRLQIRDLDSSPINDGSSRYPIAIYHPYGSHWPLPG